MTVQRLIELLEEIKNKELQVMTDATMDESTGFRLVAVKDCSEVGLPSGGKVCLIMNENTVLFDEDGERLN